MSEETKNPLIESFLKLHELAGGTYQDTLPMAQRLKNAELAKQNREFQRKRPFDRKDVPSGGAGEGSGGQPSTMRVVPPRPAMDTAPQPQPNMALQRQQSGDVAPKPQPSMSLQRQQSGDVAPKLDNSASMNRAKTDFQTRVGGVERQNPILAPGKLEGGNLQFGSKGDSVKELQRKLGVEADGIFGKNTADALKAFQQKNNLKVDAVYGTQSASALNKSSSMDSLKKENPVGAYVSSQTVKPMSPMAGQTTSGLMQSRILPDRTKLLKNNNIDRMESTEMSNKLIEAFMKLQTTNSSNLFNEAKKAKKLDPVGKEDEDIDNDGDKDKSDSYLHNRRKAIKAAMKEAKDPHAEGMVKAGTKAPEMTTDPDYLKKKKPEGGNSKVIQTGPNSSTVTKSTNEEVEQIDEALTAAHKAAIAKHVGKMWGKKGNVSFSKEGGKHFVSHSDGIETHVHSIDMKKGVPHVTHFMTMQEEVEFSEAELEHIASILEANPVAPVPDEYSGAAGGVSKRDLSDETVAEEEMKRGRGRPKGSTGSSKHGDGKGEGSEPKNLASQIRFSRPSGGNFMLKHPTTGVTKAVPAKAATEFYNKYTASEKPAQKQAHHDEFLAKHFGSSEKPKTGITLPKIPAPKS